MPYTSDRPWTVRRDPFSTCRPGFELRTYRLCRRVLMFHHFAELGPDSILVASTDLEYEESEVANAAAGRRTTAAMCSNRVVRTAPRPRRP